MRILVDIGHPAHVHFFKNFIWEMDKRGHQLLVTARDKDIALHLLTVYGIEYIAVGKAGKGKLSFIREWIGRDREIYSIARRFRPDIITGIHNPCVAHVARLTGAKSIIFTDTEHAKIANMVTFPFSDVVCTPSCFKKNLGKKHVRYNGYHELAYLHPNYFKPDPSVLSELGLSENDMFIIIRFVSWGASHDIGQSGFDLATKRKLVDEIAKYGRVMITSEGPLPEEFEEYQIKTPPEKLHDLLYYATMYFGEGGTMATEAAILGIPSIYVSPLWDTMGNFIELGSKYELIHSFRETDKAIQKALELLQQPDLKENWVKKRQRLLVDKIDATQFVVDFIENFPESCNQIKRT